MKKFLKKRSVGAGIGYDLSGNFVQSLNQAFFYNTTWAEERGKCLPDPEFFAWVLSFLLEFWVFSWVLSFSIIIFGQFSKTFNTFGKNYMKLVEFGNICKQKWHKMRYPMNFFLFLEVFGNYWVFFLSFSYKEESASLRLSFFLEFLAWVLVFLAAGVKKKPDLSTY